MNQDCLKIQYLALRELITTVFVPRNLRHFNIELSTFIAIKNLNSNLSTSMISANNL